MNAPSKTKSKCLQALDALDSSLDRVVGYCEGLDEGQLHRKPEGQWSAAQIVQHLCLSEKASLKYLRYKKDKGETAPAAGLGASVRSKLLNKALRSKTRKFKVPPGIQQPDERPEWKELIAEYREIRRDWRQFISDMDDKNLKRAVFKHPVAGRINMLQTTEFLTEHFKRHEEQIRERTLP